MLLVNVTPCLYIVVYSVVENIHMLLAFVLFFFAILVGCIHISTKINMLCV